MDLVTSESSRLVAMSGGVTLDFDNTVIFQAALFVVLLLVLKPLLFDPMLRIFALREERTEGARAEARALQEQAGELLTRQERELDRVAQIAAEERERINAETARLHAEILNQARQSAQKILDDGRRQIKSEVDQIAFRLGQESQKAGEEIVRRMLGREVT
jgi:F-type H+-transporting ATPase subunit b